MFWRLTAQRLLVDGNRQDAIPKLLKLLDQPAPVSVHALWVLHGLGALDPEKPIQVSDLDGSGSSKKCHPRNSTQSRRAENALRQCCFGG